MPRTGRPRTFDHDAALDGAMFLFWEQGYDGVSIDQLREAMGNLSTASIYGTFGSKQDLFRLAFARYVGTYGQVTEPLFDPTLSPREAIETALLGSAEMQTGEGHPAGCMVALSATVHPPGSAALSALVAEKRGQNRLGIRDCVERALQGRPGPVRARAEAVAAMVEAFLLGISTQVRDGVPLSAIKAAISALMGAWDALLTGDPATTS